MADESLNSAVKGISGGAERKSALNKNSSEFKPMFPKYVPQHELEREDEEFVSTVGSALDGILSHQAVKSKYRDTPTGSVSPSPMPSTAQATPQMSAVFLPPPPGYDPIVEPETNVYYDPSMYSTSPMSGSWGSYPPPFHLGFKLFVGALPYSVCEGDLFPLFSQFGEILELHIQRDWLGRSKGCAWLRYSSKEECDAAIEALHNNYFLGSMNRPMQLTYASDSAEKRSRGVRTNSFSSMEKEEVVSGRSRAMTADQPNPAITAAVTASSSSTSVLGKLRMLVNSEQQPEFTAPILVESSIASSSPPREAVSHSERKLHVSGFPPHFQDDKELADLFNQFGPIISIQRIEASVAVVEFEFLRDAQRARSVIDGVTLPSSNEPLVVLPVF
jgi:RNA recognition motif-containing protein